MSRKSEGYAYRSWRHLPSAVVIYTVTLAWIFTALVTSLVPLLGIVTLARGQSSVEGVCGGVLFILVGSFGVAFHLYAGWSFYTFKPYAYDLTRKSCGSPNFCLPRASGSGLIQMM